MLNDAFLDSVVDQAFLAAGELLSRRRGIQGFLLGGILIDGGHLIGYFHDVPLATASVKSDRTHANE